MLCLPHPALPCAARAAIDDAGRLWKATPSLLAAAVDGLAPYDGLAMPPLHWMALNSQVHSHKLVSMRRLAYSMSSGRGLASSNRFANMRANCAIELGSLHFEVK